MKGVTRHKKILSLTTNELSNIYSDNKYLVNLLKKNKQSHYIGSQNSIRNEMYSNIQKMNTDYQFKSEPAFKKLKEENDKFLSDYRNAKKYMKNKNSKETFKSLIKTYIRRGYKIPDLSVKHNLFSLCPLIDENKDRFIQGFSSDPKLKEKTITYLKKLRSVVEERLHIENEEDFMMKLATKTEENIKVPINQDLDEESNEALLHNIDMLLDLINNKVIDKIDALYTERPITTTRSTRKEITFKRSNSKKTSFDFLNLKSNSINPKTPKRAIPNFFMCTTPSARSRNLLNFRNPTTFMQRTPNTSRRQSYKSPSGRNSYKSPSGKFGSTISTTFRTTRGTNFNNGFCLSLENKYTTKEDLIKFAYEKGKKNDSFAVNNALKVLLKKYKNINENDVEDYICDYKENIDNHLILKSIDKTKKIISQKDLDKKTRSIYLNSYKLKKIKPLLKMMEESDQKIKKMDKKLIQGIVPK